MIITIQEGSAGERQDGIFARLSFGRSISRFPILDA